jgi:lipid-binding SYLF domain-containing protein
LATAPAPEDEMLRDATLVLRHALSPPAAIPRSVMMRARAIAVVPRTRRDGGLYRGLGALSGRGGLDGWTPPAVVAFQGGLPLSLESDEMDFVFVALTMRGVDHLTEPRFAGLIMDVIDAGSIGEFTPSPKADLVAYIRFDLLFAGVTVSDWEFTEVRTSHERLYGRPYSTNDLLRGAGFFHMPKAARAWHQALVSHLRETS